MFPDSADFGSKHHVVVPAFYGGVVSGDAAVAVKVLSIQGYIPPKDS